MSDEILFRERDCRGTIVALVRLNRPDKGNALTLAMLDELDSVFSRIATDRRIRAVVLRGSGRFFCAGGDILDWASMSATEMGQRWILRGIEVFERIASLPQPVIAAINGHVLGGGLELALAADLRVVVAGSRIALPEVGLGMIAGWGGVRRVAELIGVSRARQFTLLGTPITPETALEWGLVHAVAENVPCMDAQVHAWLESLLANAPVAMALTKQLLNSMHTDMREAFAEAVSQAAATEDCREGVAAFREKRVPVYRNC